MNETSKIMYHIFVSIAGKCLKNEFGFDADIHELFS